VRRLSLLLAVAALALGGVAAAAGALPGTKTAADRVAWRALLHWPKACEEVWQPGGPGAGVQLQRTATARRLVEVTCFFGPYQYSTMLYLLDAGRHVNGPLVLTTYIDPGSGKPTATHETIMLGVLSFEPRSGRLQLFDKARGPGDCGIYTVASLVGTRLVTREVHARLACTGKPPFDPARWPKLRLP